jgi:NAD(P)-dependent dehydrogenase (short-subunit alcohol dehydrogenase family)
MISSVVLITGALSGMDKAAALAFARAGYGVATPGRRDDAGQAVADELHALGADASLARLMIRIYNLCQRIAKSAVGSPRPNSGAAPDQATALARPARKATADAASLRFGLARGSLRARFRRRAAAPISRPRGASDDRSLWYNLRADHGD